MFTDLKNILHRAKTIDFTSIYVKVLKNGDVQQFIIDLNAIDQLFERGLDSDGELTGTYSEASELFSKSLNLPKEKKEGDPYNFFVTGKFLESFAVKVFDNGDFIISADALKEEGDDLIDKFGPLLGLTDESKGKLIRELLPRIIKEARAFIFRG